MNTIGYIYVYWYNYIISVIKANSHSLLWLIWAAMKMQSTIQIIMMNWHRSY